MSHPTAAGHTTTATPAARQTGNANRPVGYRNHRTRWTT